MECNEKQHCIMLENGKHLKCQCGEFDLTPDMPKWTCPRQKMTLNPSSNSTEDAPEVVAFFSCLEEKNPTAYILPCSLEDYDDCDFSPIRNICGVRKGSLEYKRILLKGLVESGQLDTPSMIEAISEDTKLEECQRTEFDIEKFLGIKGYRGLWATKLENRGA